MAEIIEFKSGVEVELRRVEPLLIYERLKGMREPKVPKVFIESKGREEENPADPAYLEALRQYEQERADIIEDMIIALGTRVVSANGVPKAEDEEWAETFDTLGFEIAPIGKKKRYIQWFRLVAIGGNSDDLRLFMEAMGRIQGVSEEDVAEAADSFRGTEERPANRAARRKKAR